MLNSLISRRRLIASGTLAPAGVALSRFAFGASMQDTSAQSPADPKATLSVVRAYLGSSPHTLRPLPYAENGFEPVISARTIGFHYGKHHRAYFYNLHQLLDGTPLAEASLEHVIMQSHDQPALADVFNNAAQAWNHNFYWNSLSSVTTKLSEKLRAAIVCKFGSNEALTKALVTTSGLQFGSG